MKQKPNTQIVKIGSPEIVKTVPYHMIDFVQEFLDSQDIKPLSKEVYRAGVLRFIAWTETNKIESPSRIDFINFKTYLVESKLSVNTINNILTSNRRFYRYLHIEKNAIDITIDVKSLAQPRGHLREMPLVNQVLEMVEKIDTSTIRGIRNHAIIALMVTCGLRTIEVVRANIEDLRPEGDVFILKVHRKGHDSKDDDNVIPEKHFKSLAFYLKIRDGQPGDPLFVSYSDRNANQRLTTKTIANISKDCFRTIGIDRHTMTAHSFRHFCITDMIINNAPMHQVQAAAGHKSMETTTRYFHNIDRIKNAAERYHKFDLPFDSKRYDEAQKEGV